MPNGKARILIAVKSLFFHKVLREIVMWFLNMLRGYGYVFVVMINFCSQLIACCATVPACQPTATCTLKIGTEQCMNRATLNRSSGTQPD